MAEAEDLLGVALLETNRLREALDRLESALLKWPGDADLIITWVGARPVVQTAIGSLAANTTEFRDKKWLTPHTHK